MVKVTGLDVALVSATAAVAAPITSWLTAKATIKHQRTADLREDRRKAYVRMLREALRKQTHVNNLIGALERADDPKARKAFTPPSFDREAFLDETAEINMFATEPIRSLLVEYDDPYFELDLDSLDVHDVQARKAFIAQAQTVLDHLTDCYTRLERQVRDEITSW